MDKRGGKDEVRAFLSDEDFSLIVILYIHSF
jgi:hypothetical protein